MALWEVVKWILPAGSGSQMCSASGAILYITFLSLYSVHIYWCTQNTPGSTESIHIPYKGITIVVYWTHSFVCTFSLISIH